MERAVMDEEADDTWGFLLLACCCIPLQPEAVVVCNIVKFLFLRKRCTKYKTQMQKFKLIMKQGTEKCLNIKNDKTISATQEPT
jgi:hypothetical protein